MCVQADEKFGDAQADLRWAHMSEDTVIYCQFPCQFALREDMLII